MDGVAYRTDPTTGQVEFSKTHGPETKETISKYMIAAGMEDPGKIEDVVATISNSRKSDTISWNGLSLDDWSIKTEAGEKRSDPDVFEKLARLDQLTTSISALMPKGRSTIHHKTQIVTSD